MKAPAFIERAAENRWPSCVKQVPWVAGVKAPAFIERFGRVPLSGRFDGHRSGVAGVKAPAFIERYAASPTMGCGGEGPRLQSDVHRVQGFDRQGRGLRG